MRRFGDTLLTGEIAGEETEACVFSLGAGAITPAACRIYPGLLLGGGDGGLLLKAGARIRVVGPPLDEGVEAELPEPLAGPFPAPFTGGKGLAILRGNVIPRVSGASMLLESYEYASTASDALAWRSAAGVTTVMSR